MTNFQILDTAAVKRYYYNATNGCNRFVVFGTWGSCPIDRVVSTGAYGSGDRVSTPRAGRIHIVFRKRLETVGAELEHDARYITLLLVRARALMYPEKGMTCQCDWNNIVEVPYVR